jgi:hypothetical protein
MAWPFCVQRVKIIILQRPSFPIMHLQRLVCTQALVALCHFSVALASSVLGRLNAVATPNDQLLAVRDQRFEFKPEGSAQTAFYAFKGTILAGASINLSDCIYNLSGEMLFVKGQGRRLRLQDTGTSVLTMEQQY